MIQSGRSGLSTRDDQACMSMQPMFTIQRSASSSSTSAYSMIFFSPSRVDAGSGTRLIHSGMCDGRLLLEEVLALPAVGIALHRERASSEVRDEHLGDVAVVRDQVALRDPLVGPERLVQIRQAELAAALLQHRWHRLAFLAHLRSMLVLAQSEVHGRAEPPLVRPLHELDLRDEARLEPDDVRATDPRHLRSLGERRVVPHERLEDLQQPVDLVVAEARADVPRPTKPPGLVDGDDEGAETARAPPLALRVTDDDDFLPLAHLHLPPLRAPPSRLVARVGSLRDDALEPLRACGRRAARRRR